MDKRIILSHNYAKMYDLLLFVKAEIVKRMF